MRFFQKAPEKQPEPPATAEQSAGDAEAIATITEICGRAAQGDLEARISGMNDDPKLGVMVRAINDMLDMADSFVRESAAAVSSFSREEFHRPILVRGLKGAYRAGAVLSNRGGAQMKASSESLALVARMASENAVAINTVAAACEELNATGNQISHIAAESLRLSETSLHQGDESLKKMDSLHAALRQVDAIVASIISISERTSLLALNASIEATRAGVQGARFSVIAEEVKELSKNSATASKGILDQVNLMRKSIEDVGSLLQTIHASISANTASASNISNSIGEQVAATGEITRQIAELTSNSKKVADQVSARQNHATR